MMPLVMASGGETVAASALDFSGALTTSLNSISTSFNSYATIAIPIGLAIWGAPKAIQLVKKFFNALTR